MKSDARLVGRKVAVPCPGDSEGTSHATSDSEGTCREGVIQSVHGGRCVISLIARYAHDVADGVTVEHETFRVRRWLQPEVDPLCSALAGI